MSTNGRRGGGTHSSSRGVTTSSSPKQSSRHSASPGPPVGRKRSTTPPSSAGAPSAPSPNNNVILRAPNSANRYTDVPLFAHASRSTAPPPLLANVHPSQGATTPPSRPSSPLMVAVGGGERTYPGGDAGGGDAEGLSESVSSSSRVTSIESLDFGDDHAADASSGKTPVSRSWTTSTNRDDWYFNNDMKPKYHHNYHRVEDGSAAASGGIPMYASSADYHNNNRHGTTLPGPPPITSSHKTSSSAYQAVAGGTGGAADILGFSRASSSLAAALIKPKSAVRRWSEGPPRWLAHRTTDPASTDIAIRERILKFCPLNSELEPLQLTQNTYVYRVRARYLPGELERIRMLATPSSTPDGSMTGGRIPAGPIVSTTSTPTIPSGAGPVTALMPSSGRMVIKAIPIVMVRHETGSGADKKVEVRTEPNIEAAVMNYLQDEEKKERAEPHPYLVRLLRHEIDYIAGWHYLMMEDCEVGNLWDLFVSDVVNPVTATTTVAMASTTTNSTTNSSITGSTGGGAGSSSLLPYSRFSHYEEMQAPSVGVPIPKYVRPRFLCIHPADTQRLFWELCMAVRTCHHRGVVHADLKPMNVFLCVNPTLDATSTSSSSSFIMSSSSAMSQDATTTQVQQPATQPTVERGRLPYSIKLGDFGLSATRHHTTNGQFANQIGAPWYRSPEFTLGSRTWHPSTDIWSLGCMFAEMMFRFPIFSITPSDAKDEDMLVWRVISETLGMPLSGNAAQDSVLRSEMMIIGPPHFPLPMRHSRLLEQHPVTRFRQMAAECPSLFACPSSKEAWFLKPFAYTVNANAGPGAIAAVNAAIREQVPKYTEWPLVYGGHQFPYRSSLPNVPGFVPQAANIPIHYEAWHLLMLMLDMEPTRRATIDQVLQHDFFKRPLHTLP